MTFLNPHENNYNGTDAMTAEIWANWAHFYFHLIGDWSKNVNIKVKGKSYMSFRQIV